jgi:hypothetical protein
MRCRNEDICRGSCWQAAIADDDNETPAESKDMNGTYCTLLALLNLDPKAALIQLVKYGASSFSLDEAVRAKTYEPIVSFPPEVVYALHFHIKDSEGFPTENDEKKDGDEAWILPRHMYQAGHSPHYPDNFSFGRHLAALKAMFCTLLKCKFCDKELGTTVNLVASLAVTLCLQ